MYSDLRKKFTKSGLVIAFLMLCAGILPAQVVLYTQTFGTLSSGLPSGCSAYQDSASTIKYNSTMAWGAATTSASTGYTGASGGSNVVANNASGSSQYGVVTYLIVNTGVSTNNITSLSVLFGSRRTTNGKSITLEWSSDSSTWNALSFTNVSNNSSWALVNSGNAISLPSAAENKSNIWFRFSFTGASASGGNTRIDDIAFGGVNAAVVPTLLVIGDVNSTVTPQTNIPFTVTIATTDASNVVAAVNQNTNIELQVVNGDGTISGTYTGTIANGQSGIVLSGVKYDSTETNFSFRVITTSGMTLTPDTITVGRVVGLQAMHVPQYIQGLNGTNNNRLSSCFYATVKNLVPNTSYRYATGVITSAEVITPTVNGAGNPIYVNSAGTFKFSSGTSLTAVANYDSITTDANGNYSGWFCITSTGNARFTPNTGLRYRLTMNNGDGLGNATYRFTTEDSVIVLNQGTGSNNGSNIYGNSFAASKNFVALYDNTTGTGRPIAVNMIEDDGAAPTASSYAPFYNSNVSAITGAWGTMIPNTLSNGIRRIASLAFSDATLLHCATDNNGVWGSGVNTVNPSTGTTALVITNADAPLGLDNPTTITGSNAVCTPTTEAYSIPALNGATYYNWSLPPGASILTGTGTNSITVSYPNGSSTGTISVYANNDCGQNSSTASLAVNINTPGSTSVAGADQFVCSSATVQLNANNPFIGQGTWTVITGSGIFANPNLYNTTVSGLSSGTNTYRWTIATTCLSAPVSTDDVTVTQVGLPTGLSSANATSTTVDVSWTSVNDADSFLVRYQAGCSGTFYYKWVAGNLRTVTLTGLTSNTSYCFRVRAHCTAYPAPQYSTTSGNFTTTCGASCVAVTNVTLANTSGCSYNVSWSNCVTADSFRVRYKSLNASVWSFSPWSTAYIASINLGPGAWMIRVQSKCGNTIYSTATTNYSIGSCRFAGESQTTSGMVLFPNPTSDRSILNFSATQQGAYSIVVSDLSGRVAQTLTGTALEGENSAVISMAGFAPGMYLVALNLNGSVQQVKLTVQ